VTAHDFSTALRTLTVREDELRCPGANLGQIDLVLVGFALQDNLALTMLALLGARHHDPLVHPLGQGSRRLLAVLVPRFTPRTLRVVARRPLRKGSGLALAPPSQLLDELLQVVDLALQRRDLALLLSHSAVKLSVLLKDFLVIRHV
jgi:hypothetical protein